MSRQMNVFVLFALLGFVSHSTAAKNETIISERCDRLMYAADQCVKDLTFLGSETIDIPQTEEQLDVYCNTFGKKTAPCLKNFSRCLNPIPRSLFNIGFRSVMKQFKNICKTRKGKNAFLSNLVCFKPKHLAVAHEYMKMATTIVEHVAKNTSADVAIVHLCCAYHSVLEKGTQELATICGRPQAVRYLISLVKAVASDLVDIACGQYSTEVTCRRLLPGVMDTFDLLTLPENRKKFDYSPMVPLVKVLNKLDTPIN